MGGWKVRRKFFNYHVAFEPKFYTERARIHYEVETYSYGAAGQELTGKTQQQQKPSFFEDIYIKDAHEEGNRNDFGPSANSKDVTFSKLTADISGTKPTEPTATSTPASTPRPKPKPRSTKKVGKSKADQPNTYTATSTATDPTSAAEPTKVDKEQTVTTKRKLQANSPPANTKKTKETWTSLQASPNHGSQLVARLGWVDPQAIPELNQSLDQDQG